MLLLTASEKKNDLLQVIGSATGQFKKGRLILPTPNLIYLFLFTTIRMTAAPIANPTAMPAAM